MLKGRRARFLSVLLAFALVSAGACSQRDDDDSDGGGSGDGSGEAAAESDIPTEGCATDPSQPVEGDTINLVSSYPQSGLTAAFSEIARGWEAYFEMMNEEEGGVTFGGETYQITYEDLDDQYNAAETVSNINELVGPDGTDAFAVFSVVGTANNAAIRDNLDALCVPNLFAATGSPAWGNPDYPWTIGSTLTPYTIEAQMFAELLAEEDPDATVAMLIQDDDFGAAYEEGFRRAIEGTDIEVVDVQSYPTGTSDVAAQVTSLAASDATAFFNGATLLACPNALTEAQSAGWEPITWVSATCTSNTLMGLAEDAGDDVYSLTNLKDPLNPAWDDDEAMQFYRENLEQYRPEGLDLENGIIAYGWTQAAVLVEAMGQAEEPTRLSLMETLRNLDGMSDVGLLLPEVTLETSPPDLYLGEDVHLMQYQFEAPDARNHYELVGELVTDYEGETVDITPAELISG